MPPVCPLHMIRCYHYLLRRDGRAVECGGLENRWARKRPGGSNPPLSARFCRAASPSGSLFSGTRMDSNPKGRGAAETAEPFASAARKGPPGPAAKGCAAAPNPPLSARFCRAASPSGSLFSGPRMDSNPLGSEPQKSACPQIEARNRGVAGNGSTSRKNSTDPGSIPTCATVCTQREGSTPHGAARPSDDVAASGGATSSATQHPYAV